MGRSDKCQIGESNQNAGGFYRTFSAFLPRKHRRRSAVFSFKLPSSTGENSMSRKARPGRSVFGNWSDVPVVGTIRLA